MTIRPLIWATTSNPLAHTEGSHTALRTLTPQTFGECLLHAMHSVRLGASGKSWEAHSLLRTSDDLMSRCDLLTAGRRSRPQIVTYPGAHTPPDNHPNGSLSSITSPRWWTGFIIRPASILPARPLAHKPGGTCHGHTRAPVHRSCCRTAPQAHSHSQTCRALLGGGLRPGASAGSLEVRAPGPIWTEPEG